MDLHSPDRSGQERPDWIVPLERPGLAAGTTAVDGRCFLGRAVRFARELRLAGLATDLGAAIDFSRALGVVAIGDREQVRAAGEAVFVRRRDEIEVYNLVFERFWRARGRRLPSQEGPLPLQPPREEADAEDEERGQTDQAANAEIRESTPEGAPRAVDDGEDTDEDGALDGLANSELAYGQGQIDRHQQFDRMTAAELRDAERLIDLLLPNLERRRTRRTELHHHGRTVAPRAMFRRSLATGGDVLDWVWKRPVRRPRQLIVICDISGSMERHARVLLRFSQALAASAVRTEAFVFGTRLTRVTRMLRDRDRDRALTRVAQTVSDWSGGTRIGESFRTFNQHWARRVLRSSAVVVVVSDGWDRGDPDLVATETARLQRSCHRLIWLNPLASAPGYQPLAAGMQAAYPYIDDFLPAGTVASLERLGRVLAGGAPGRPSGRPHRRAGGHRLGRDGTVEDASATRRTITP
ncbi:MAG: vWA domain-containing protein, partial [Candidatus Limnocylindrales bacterium]